MSRSYSDVLLETMLERSRLLRNWRQLARAVAKAVKELYPNARVYLAGSVARGEWIAASDIDIVVVLDHEPCMREAAQVIEHAWKKLDLPLNHPIEIHVIGPNSLEKYKKNTLLQPLEPE